MQANVYNVAQLSNLVGMITFAYIKTNPGSLENERLPGNDAVVEWVCGSGGELGEGGEEGFGEGGVGVDAGGKGLGREA